MTKITKRNMLKDSMYNLSADSGATDEYARGALVGAVSALMATGMSYHQALEAVVKCFPADYREQCIPSHWLSDVKAVLAGKPMLRKVYR